MTGELPAHPSAENLQTTRCLLYTGRLAAARGMSILALTRRGVVELPLDFVIFG
jgi:hypothetical protein